MRRSESTTSRSCVHVVKPALPLPLDPDFLAGRITAETLVAMGYRDARRYLAGCSPDGVALDPSATAMTEPPLGARFTVRARGELGGDGVELHLAGRSSTWRVSRRRRRRARRSSAGCGTTVGVHCRWRTDASVSSTVRWGGASRPLAWFGRPAGRARSPSASTCRHGVAWPPSAEPRLPWR